MNSLASEWLVLNRPQVAGFHSPGDILVILETIEKPVLIHYGSYETTFLRAMAERYGQPPQASKVGSAFTTATNLVSLIFAQIYFPTYSNSLKDLGAWLGFKWSCIKPSGVQSIIWRMDWERANDTIVKQNLLTYNTEDCAALRALTDILVRLCSLETRPKLESGTESGAVLVEDARSWDTLWRRFTTPVEDFELINKAAHWDYQRDKIYVKTDANLKRRANSGKRTIRRIKRLNKEIWFPPIRACPACGRKPQRKASYSKVINDIRFNKFGVRRWVVKYHFFYCSCVACHKYFALPEELARWCSFGRNLVMFVVYQTVDLCMPQRTVSQNLNRLFGLGLQERIIHRLKARAATYFTATREGILASILEGKVVHADETPIVLKHKRGYVWVLTSSRAVAYFYTDTREGGFAQEKLRGFNGVLVSDFFAAYDALPCLKQKCLIHLMRDLNDALLDNPYDEELKVIATGFGELLRSILQTIDRRGLKSHFLRKHIDEVERFYRKLLTAFTSDVAMKWRERFMRTRDGLFTFLTHDGVPWNNNNAEHAIKAFARLRRAIVGLSTVKGIEEYLVLLSICQTCKYIGVDFLDFLLSGEKDIQAFAEGRGRRKRKTPQDLETLLTGQKEVGLRGGVVLAD